MARPSEALNWVVVDALKARDSDMMHMHMPEVDGENSGVMHSMPPSKSRSSILGLTADVLLVHRDHAAGAGLLYCRSIANKISRVTH